MIIRAKGRQDAREGEADRMWEGEGKRESFVFAYKI